MQLAGDVVQPLLQPVALHGARGGSQLRGGLAVGEVLHDDRALGQDLAVVELQGGDVALRVECPEVLAAGRLLRLGVDALGLEGKAQLAQDDVRGK